MLLNTLDAFIGQFSSCFNQFKRFNYLHGRKKLSFKSKLECFQLSFQFLAISLSSKELSSRAFRRELLSRGSFLRSLNINFSLIF